MKSSPSHTGVFHMEIKHQISFFRLQSNESFPSLSAHIFFYNIFRYQWLFINTLLQYFVCFYRLDQKALSFVSHTDKCGPADTDKSATYCTTELTINFRGELNVEKSSQKLRKNNVS
jgi:hypothetical protein